MLSGTGMSGQKGMCQALWRLLESEDEFVIGHVWWRYYCLSLPDSVLKALHCSILNWE
jgi:hypothetical protein